MIIIINDEIDVEWYSFLERTPPLPSVSVECTLVREAGERDRGPPSLTLATDLSLTTDGSSTIDFGAEEIVIIEARQNNLWRLSTKKAPIVCILNILTTKVFSF